MDNIPRKASSIGLVLVLMATMFVSFPFVSAPPPDKCEPWPECKDGGEEPPADPAIAFINDEKIRGDASEKLMVMNADGSNQVVIYSQEYHKFSGSPSWSPDGNSIAWCGYTYTPNVPGKDYGVWRIDVEIIDGVPQGSNLQQLVSLSEYGSYYRASWSPLGDEIAYFVRLYDPNAWKIDAVPAAGGTPYNIYTAPEGHALDPGTTWSSDGTRLAVEGGEVAAGDEGRSTMIIERATGEVIDTLLPGLDVAGLDWARQGSDVLAFHMGGMIHTVDIDTEIVVPITEGCCASWSPDNSKIVYKQPGGKPNTKRISVYEFSTGNIDRLADGIWGPDWRRF